jgi:hypothetical protein
MESSFTTTWIIISLLTIVIILRIFGRKILAFGKSLPDRGKKITLVSIGVLISIGLTILIFSLLLPSPKNNYEPANRPSISNHFTTPKDLASANPGVFKYIEQRVCEASDSVGEAQCILPNYFFNTYRSEDIWFDRFGRIAKHIGYYQYTDGEGFINKTIGTFKFEYLNRMDDFSKSILIVKIFLGDSVISTDTTVTEKSFEDGLLMEEGLTSSSSENYLLKYKFDDQDRQIEESKYVSDSSGAFMLSERTLNSYISDSVMESNIYYSQIKEATRIIVFNKNGRCIREISKNSDGQFFEYLFEYDSKGRMVNFLQYSDRILERSNTFAYDSEGRLIKEVNWSISSDSTTYLHRNSVEFNVKGDVISHTDSFIVDGTFQSETKERYLYEYDSERDDYWTEMTVYYNGKIMYFIERNYEFY